MNGSKRNGTEQTSVRSKTIDSKKNRINFFEIYVHFRMNMLYCKRHFGFDRFSTIKMKQQR